MTDTLLILPCYNEAARLDAEPFLRGLEARPWLRLLFVNDGSTDATEARLRELAQRAPAQIEVLSLPENRGKAGAVHAGLLRGLDSDASRLGYWDADLATPLEELDRLAAEMDRHDAFCVLASRVRLLGRAIQRRHARHYLGRLFATAASAVLSLPVYDTQCGAKLLRNDEAAREILTPPFSSRWIFDVELLSRVVAYDRRHATRLASTAIREVPLSAWQDVAGSKIRLRDGLRAGADLARIAWRLRRPH